ncbi:unnamed protein product, partial [Ectocarpus sp. 4 AP-2014]
SARHHRHITCSHELYLVPLLSPPFAAMVWVAKTSWLLQSIHNGRYDEHRSSCSSTLQPSRCLGLRTQDDLHTTFKVSFSMYGCSYAGNVGTRNNDSKGIPFLYRCRPHRRTPKYSPTTGKCGRERHRPRQSAASVFRYTLSTHPLCSSLSLHHTSSRFPLPPYYCSSLRPLRRSTPW